MNYTQGEINELGKKLENAINEIEESKIKFMEEIIEAMNKLINIDDDDLLKITSTALRRDLIELIILKTKQRIKCN